MTSKKRPKKKSPKRVTKRQGKIPANKVFCTRFIFNGVDEAEGFRGGLNLILDRRARVNDHPKKTAEKVPNTSAKLRLTFILRHRPLYGKAPPLRSAGGPFGRTVECLRFG